MQLLHFTLLICYGTCNLTGAYTEKMKGGFLKIAREAREKILLINIHLFMIMRTRDDNGLRTRPCPALQFRFAQCCYNYYL